MKTLTIEVGEPVAKVWSMLPQAAQKLITAHALEALLNGELYPTGAEQLELAIDLTEAGVDLETISRLSRLDRDLFEPFLKK